MISSKKMAELAKTNPTILGLKMFQKVVIEVESKKLQQKQVVGISEPTQPFKMFLSKNLLQNILKRNQFR